MSYRKRNILIASGLALLAVVLMAVYISKAHSTSSAGKRLVPVLVAKHDIRAGTPGPLLQTGAFETKLVPRSAAVPGWLTTPRQVRREAVTQDILAGEQVTELKFGPLAASGVRSQIRGYQRVVQLSGDPNQVLDGTLKPGDRIDVFGSWTPVSCQTCRVSSVVVRNALVLKTSADLGPGQSGQVPVQLRLTDEEANAVLWLVKNGSWWLMLRPVVKPRSHSIDLSTAASVLKELKRRGLLR